MWELERDRSSNPPAPWRLAVIRREPLSCSSVASPRVAGRCAPDVHTTTTSTAEGDRGALCMPDMHNSSQLRQPVSFVALCMPVRAPGSPRPAFGAAGGGASAYRGVEAFASPCAPPGGLQELAMQPGRQVTVVPRALGSPA